MTASKQEGREHEQKSGECTFGQSYDKCGEYKNCEDCMKTEPSWLSKRDALVAQQERERVLQKLILCVADMGFPIENKSNEFDDGRACAYGYFMRQINNLLETPNPSTNKCRCLVSDEQVAIEKELEGFPSEGDGY